MMQPICCSLLVILISSIITTLVQAVNLNVTDILSKEDLLSLDRDATAYYDDDYISMARRKVSFDDELLRTIRSLRHTHVFHFYDYRYSSLDTMNKSMGLKVNQELCFIQLKALVSMSQEIKSNPSASLPIDVVNFLDSSAKVESGALNGNTVWRGAINSCLRARIAPEHWISRLNSQDKLNLKELQKKATKYSSSPKGDLMGRHCMGHLKSKSWPTWDKYFEDRLSIKIGVCLPESCHSLPYHENQEIQEMVDSLARSNLVSPFGGDNYKLTSLYCFPDDDSEFRQWDLSTKFFIFLSITWATILIYANIKYEQRMKAIQKLRDSVDIKMIINQRRNSLVFNSGESTTSDSSANESDLELSANKIINVNNVPIISHSFESDPSSSNDNSKTNATSAPNATNGGGGGGLPALETSKFLQPTEDGGSKNVTPIPSDVEENDGDFNVIRPIVCDRSSRRSSKQAEMLKTQAKQLNSSNKAKQNKPNASNDNFDFIKAFSISSNIEYLFKSREKEYDLKDSSVMRQKVGSVSAIKRLSQQLGSVNRRISSSNEALMKELQENNRSKIAIELDNSSKKKNSRKLEDNSGGKRVNVDVFDGIKAIATSYIVFGHTLMLFFGVVMDLRFSTERMFDFTTLAVINALQVVGAFYIITGTFISYISFSKQKTKQLLQPSFWILVVAGRYIRLISPYLLIYWYAHNVATYTGSGPFWQDYRTDDEYPRTFCSNQDWSSVLFMSAADVKIPFDCVPQAWYLSNDFRTLLIIPIFIILLVLNTTAGYCAIATTIIYSLVKLYNYLNQVNIDYGVLMLWQPHVYSILTDRLHAVYTKLDVRISTYLMGIMLGHLLYLYDQRRIVKWPRFLRKYGMKAALINILLLFFAAIILANPNVNQFLPSAKSLDSSTIVAIIPLFKTSMELSICTCLLLLATGGGYKWLRGFFSSKFAKVMSQISYGVFLCHIEIMYKTPMFKIESDYWFLYSLSSFYIAQSYIVAFLMYILLEMPINNLLRQIFKRLFKLMVK